MKKKYFGTDGIRGKVNVGNINGEKFFGITVHYIDKSIDTGDIIVQKKYPINSKDNFPGLDNLCLLPTGI